jgi:osmotically-inducible protein OsmY
MLSVRMSDASFDAELRLAANAGRLDSRHLQQRRPLGQRWPSLVALALCLAVPVLGGCAAIVIGGAAAGVAATHDRRSYATIADDQEIEIRAMSALAENREVGEHTSLSATSYNRKVLLVGQAQTQQLADQAAEIVSRLPKVERVINEISVGPSVGWTRQGEDGLITAQSKIALTNINIKGFDPLRVKIVTEAGVVYLMGLVTPEEGDAAAEAIRYVSGVKRVVKLFEYVEPKAQG